MSAKPLYGQKLHRGFESPSLPPDADSGKMRIIVNSSSKL